MRTYVSASRIGDAYTLKSCIDVKIILQMVPVVGADSLGIGPNGYSFPRISSIISWHLGNGLALHTVSYLILKLAPLLTHLTSFDLIDDFTVFGVACTRGKIITSEFAMETLRLVDLINRRHDVTRRCDRRFWWQLKCIGGNGPCIGNYFYP